MNQSLSRVKTSDLNRTQNYNQEQFCRGKQNSVDILFKGLKRKISQRSYSKIKNSYKARVIENTEQVPFGNFSTNKPKLRLKNSIVSNKIVDPQQAHEELLRLKQINHQLFEQNGELLRKIRKQQKIQQIYKKKLQGRELIQLDYFKVLQIKLLLQVEALQNQLQEKQTQYQQKQHYIRSKKNSFKQELIEKKIQLYETMIKTQEDYEKFQKQKSSIFNQKNQKLQLLLQKVVKVKSSKHQKSQTLNQIKRQIKQVRQKFKLVEAQSKRDKNGTQLAGITNLMSKLITDSCKSWSSNQNSSAILKNNMSSISVKNKNNIQELQKQIQKIKEECDLINSEVQEFMDEKIKQKILIHKQINTIEQKQRKQRQIQNRNLICNNSASIGKYMQSYSTSRINRNPLKGQFSFQ